MDGDVDFRLNHRRNFGLTNIIDNFDLFLSAVPLAVRTRETREMTIFHFVKSF